MYATPGIITGTLSRITFTMFIAMPYHDITIRKTLKLFIYPHTQLAKTFIARPSYCLVVSQDTYLSYVWKSMAPGCGVGRTPLNFLRECAARFSKPWPFFRPGPGNS